MKWNHGLDDDDGQPVDVLQPIVEAVLVLVRAEAVVIRQTQTEKIPEETDAVECLDRQGQDAADQRQVVAMLVVHVEASDTTARRGTSSRPSSPL